MSGFEHYRHELSELDHEIVRMAAVCGVDLNDKQSLQTCLNEHHSTWSGDKARETLHGLLQLRLKIETEMLIEGDIPPIFSLYHHSLHSDEENISPRQEDATHG